MSLRVSGVRTGTSNASAGHESSVEQLPGNVPDDGGARTDPEPGPAPGADVTGEDTAGEDAVDATLATVLASHPEAVFFAHDANAATVPMPDSLDLNGHGVIEGRRSALDMVVPQYRGVVIDTWEKARKTGVASAHVRLAADPDRGVMLHFLDARAQHGVYLGAFTADERGERQPGEEVIAHTTPTRNPRFARVRKDGLAILIEIDEAFTQILGWRPKRYWAFGRWTSSIPTTRRWPSIAG